ncbi:hypothetical protein J7K76_06150 [Candidatus Bipolaricaulota bacterium]|nr:hypothetical protein [Candidatus Bipolaricaulota bacterium]
MKLLHIVPILHRLRRHDDPVLRRVLVSTAIFVPSTTAHLDQPRPHNHSTSVNGPASSSRNLRRKREMVVVWSGTFRNR